MSQTSYSYTDHDLTVASSDLALVGLTHEFRWKATVDQETPVTATDDFKVTYGCEVTAITLADPPTDPFVYDFSTPSVSAPLPDYTVTPDVCKSLVKLNWEVKSDS